MTSNRRKKPSERRAALLRECESLSERTFGMRLVRRTVADAISPDQAVHFVKWPWIFHWTATLFGVPWGGSIEVSEKHFFREYEWLLTRARDVMVENKQRHEARGPEGEA